MNETLKKRAKKANAKLQKSNKPRYVSKAEREKLAQPPKLSPVPKEEEQQ